MSHQGRIIAVMIAIGMILFTTGLNYWSSKTHGWISVSIGAAIFAAVALPLSWIIGRKYDQLKIDSFVDCVTDIYNRRFVELSFPKLSLQAQRNHKRLSVILIDVNDFKEVNDRFGHARGDMALKLISQTLKDCSTKGEIVARWGGDEFIMICPYADDKSIDKLSAQLHEQLLKLSQQSGLLLSVSLGSAVCPVEGSKLTQLVQTADKRMYAHKVITKRIAAEPEIKQA
ncbi:hypothetical protein Back11_31460 [Paenibacillus baekrokdamisoli]|uniref:Uncharacterized protein n=1 Tax=Paenibacillus baekrokdamisoli TaxID=1712516 RepID=A0A3G9J7N0_9BACL|nr:GGDEF domain-containing protein [Paenibacillus baekrokdamisoli]MBB3071690.1 diguanylate cyclase (GGDEF)-like protein [Paenibacillus baekrokdamisoli]BBH21801.1 hypothetical protein Back11_31460 [Paenibacillus baekrokdamisoli]